MKNEIFVCKARVVFGQDVVFFRTLSKNTKNRRGSRGGRRVKKYVLFFEHPCFSRVFAKKKSTFFTIPGIPGGGSNPGLEYMLVSAKLTFLWSGGNGVSAHV